MKKENAFSLALSAISAVIIIWGAIKGCLTTIIPSPMWVLILILTLPFVSFVALGCLLGRVKRKFKIGDRVRFVNSTEELVVIDYVRFNPFLVVVQAKQKDDRLVEMRYTNRLDPKVHIKYLTGINPISRSDAFARFCEHQGIKPVEATIQKM